MLSLIILNLFLHQNFTNHFSIKKEVDRLIDIGILQKIHYLQLEAPAFIIKNKNGTVICISDFRELDKTIKWKNFLIL